MLLTKHIFNQIHHMYLLQMLILHGGNVLQSIKHLFYCHLQRHEKVKKALLSNCSKCKIQNVRSIRTVILNGTSGAHKLNLGDGGCRGRNNNLKNMILFHFTLLRLCWNLWHLFFSALFSTNI